MRLTDKQRKFCDEYLIDLNATQAAIRAGYTEKYANTNASKLLQNTTISQYIGERQKELSAQDGNYSGASDQGTCLDSFF